jgi:hypothetical protein
MISESYLSYIDLIPHPHLDPRYRIIPIRSSNVRTLGRYTHATAHPPTQTIPAAIMFGTTPAIIHADDCVNSSQRNRGKDPQLEMRVRRRPWG